jgi:hypothetical protein
MYIAKRAAPRIARAIFGDVLTYPDAERPRSRLS